MTVTSLKDYAAQKNVTYEAVRQQVNRYKDELNGHIIKDGRQQFLDEVAVAFLDEKREKSPVTIIQQSKDEAIEELERTKEQLLIKIASQADKIAELAEWKAENALAIAHADQAQLLLETKTAELDKERQKRSEAEAEAEAARRETVEAKKREDEALARAEALQKELDQEKNKGFFKRLFGI